MAPSNKLVVIDLKGDAIVSVSKPTGDSTEKVSFLVNHNRVGTLKLFGNTSDIYLSEDDAASMDTMELILRCANSPQIPTRFHSLPIEEYEQLLYPAFIFGERQIFATVTKWSAYNAVGEIQEQNPLVQHNNVSYRAMHLPEEVIGAIRGAKTALQGKLISLLDRHKQLSAPSTCPQTCPRCGLGFEDFMKRLLGPHDSVEDMLDKRSIVEILGFISDFEHPRPNSEEDSDESDNKCRDWFEEIRADGWELRKAFEGLCLDCMSLSVNKIVLDNTGSRPCNACKWHGEMTWEHSNIGPLQP
ncbi:hypothetical protein GGR58DRAFT_505142 [Xylaria digitata]|nr:hypothetical protein GGR58DRAFT_505142 [Xylaria digitata]